MTFTGDRKSIFSLLTEKACCSPLPVLKLNQRTPPHDKNKDMASVFEWFKSCFQSPDACASYFYWPHCSSLLGTNLFAWVPFFELHTTISLSEETKCPRQENSKTSDLKAVQILNSQWVCFNTKHIKCTIIPFQVVHVKNIAERRLRWF